MSSVPPSASRRPRYLVVALIGALVLGAGCWTEGCSRLAFYRGERDQRVELNSRIRDDAERGRAEALYQRYVDLADAASKRAIPLAAATFVLGAALLTLAGRGFAGRVNARSVLVQVVSAQACLVVATHYFTRQARAAELDWQVESALIAQRETLPADQYDQLVPAMYAMRRYGVPGWLVFRTLASALIVVALTRPRSRAFFEGAGASPASGR